MGHMDSSHLSENPISNSQLLGTRSSKPLAGVRKLCYITTRHLTKHK